MTLDIEIVQMVRDSARRYSARYDAHFKQIEASGNLAFPYDFLGEAERLGWADQLAPSDATSDSTQAEMLGNILLEVARHSPATAMRLLAHHLARTCIAHDGRATLGKHEGTVTGWLGLSAAVLDNRLEPTLSLVATTSGQQLRGTMRFVIAGDTARYCVGPVRSAEGDLGLALVASAAAKSTLPVASLGLRGFGPVDLTMDEITEVNFHLLAHGADALARLAKATRLAAIGYYYITLAILEHAQRIASEHASLRRQNGRLLRDVPAVRSMLSCIDQAVELTRIAVRASGDPTQPIEELLGTVHDAALAATDAGLQALGGVGYMEDLDMERLWRDMRQVGQHCAPAVW